MQTKEIERERPKNRDGVLLKRSSMLEGKEKKTISDEGKTELERVRMQESK